MRPTISAVPLLVLMFCGTLWADDAALRRDAEEGLRRASMFFRNEVSTEGGYLGRYSEDLSKREAEGRATASMVWVQPPGTPTVGQTFLRAYHATRDPYYLQLATDVGHCLVRGQLHSGGWGYTIDFQRNVRRPNAYRVDGDMIGGASNTTTLDDNTTQAAMRFLMQLDQALEGGDPRIRDAIDYGLQRLLQAQYPNGAWPQQFSGRYTPENYPVKQAEYPKDWPPKFPGLDYRDYYTLNDYIIRDMIDVMLDAARYYGDPRYFRSALKAGEFLILAQLPDPQPGWAQQYDRHMHPAWARRFEPPAITGGESLSAMRDLIRLYRVTADKRFLEPLPRALDYYQRSLLPDGRLARFYELQTNKPLYFTMKYELTYDDSDLPTHYGFKVGNGAQRLAAIADEYQQVLTLEPSQLKLQIEPGFPRTITDDMRTRVREVLDQLDDRGRWVDDGGLPSYGSGDDTKRIIDTRTFIANVRILSDFLAATGDPLASDPVFLTPATLMPLLSAD